MAKLRVLVEVVEDGHAVAEQEMTGPLAAALLESCGGSFDDVVAEVAMAAMQAARGARREPVDEGAKLSVRRALLAREESRQPVRVATRHTEETEEDIISEVAGAERRAASAPARAQTRPTVQARQTRTVVDEMRARTRELAASGALKEGANLQVHVDKDIPGSEVTPWPEPGSDEAEMLEAAGLGSAMQMSRRV